MRAIEAIRTTSTIVDRGAAVAAIGNQVDARTLLPGLANGGETVPYSVSETRRQLLVIVQLDFVRL